MFRLCLRGCVLGVRTNELVSKHLLHSTRPTSFKLVYWWDKHEPMAINSLFPDCSQSSNCFDLGIPFDFDIHSLSNLIFFQAISELKCRWTRRYMLNGALVSSIKAYATAWHIHESKLGLTRALIISLWHGFCQVLNILQQLNSVLTQRYDHFVSLKEKK